MALDNLRKALTGDGTAASATGTVKTTRFSGLRGALLEAPATQPSAAPAVLEPPAKTLLDYDPLARPAGFPGTSATAEIGRVDTGAGDMPPPPSVYPASSLAGMRRGPALAPAPTAGPRPGLGEALSGITPVVTPRTTQAIGMGDVRAMDRSVPDFTPAPASPAAQAPRQSMEISPTAPIKLPDAVLRAPTQSERFWSYLKSIPDKTIQTVITGASGVNKALLIPQLLTGLGILNAPEDWDRLVQESTTDITPTTRAVSDIGGQVVGTVTGIGAAGTLGKAATGALARALPEAARATSLGQGALNLVRGLTTGTALQGAREAADAFAGQSKPDGASRIAKEAVFFGLLDTLLPAAGGVARKALPGSLEGTRLGAALTGGAAGTGTGAAVSGIINTLFKPESDDDRSVLERVLTDAATIGLLGAAQGFMGFRPGTTGTLGKGPEIVGTRIGGHIYRGIPAEEVSFVRRAKGDLSKVGYTEWKPGSGVWQKRDGTGRLVAEVHEDVIVNGRQVPKVVAARASRSATRPTQTTSPEAAAATEPNRSATRESQPGILPAPARVAGAEAGQGTPAVLPPSPEGQAVSRPLSNVSEPVAQEPGSVAPTSPIQQENQPPVAPSGQSVAPTTDAAPAPDNTAPTLRTIATKKPLADMTVPELQKIREVLDGRIRKAESATGKQGQGWVPPSMQRALAEDKATVEGLIAGKQPLDRTQVLRDANPGMDEKAIVDLVRTTSNLTDAEFQGFAQRMGKPEAPTAEAPSATPQAPAPEAASTQTPREPKTFTGWNTPVNKGQEARASLQGINLPDGMFIALDQPFESDIHNKKNARQVTAQVQNTFDPDGLLDPANHDAHAPIVQEFTEAVNEALRTGTIKDALGGIRTFYRDFLKSKGFDSYVRGIDGDPKNRELIVFDRNSVKSEQPAKAGSPDFRPKFEKLKFTRPNSNTWTAGDLTVTKSKGYFLGNEADVYTVTHKGKPLEGVDWSQPRSLEEAKRQAQNYADLLAARTEKDRVEGVRSTAKNPARDAARAKFTSDTAFQNFLKDPNAWRLLLTKPQDPAGRYWIQARAEAAGAPFPQKVGDLLEEQASLLTMRPNKATQENLKRVRADFEKAIGHLVKPSDPTFLERLLKGETPISLTGKKAPPGALEGRVETPKAAEPEAPMPQQGKLFDDAALALTAEQQEQLAAYRTELAEMEKGLAETRATWETEVEKLSKDLAADATKLNNELRTEFFKQIKDRGYIRPYAKGYLKEDLLSRVPKQLIRRNGAMNLDKMADALGYESDEALVNEIEKMDRVRAVEPGRHRLEAEDYVGFAKPDLKAMLDYYTTAEQGVREAIEELEGIGRAKAKEAGAARPVADSQAAAGGAGGEVQGDRGGDRAASPGRGEAADAQGEAQLRGDPAAETGDFTVLEERLPERIIEADDPKTLDDVPSEQVRALPDDVDLPNQDYAQDLFNAARELDTPSRYKRLAEAAGRFVTGKPKARIELADVSKVATAAHELGHAVDFRVNDDKFPRSVKARFPGTRMTESALRSELATVSNFMRPVDGGVEKFNTYRQRPTELMADFYSLYLVDPNLAREMAPALTAEVERVLTTKADVAGVIADLHERRKQSQNRPDMSRIRPVEEMMSPLPREITDPTEATKALVKNTERIHQLQVQEAARRTQRWRKLLTEEQLEDVGAAVEGIGNLRTNKSAEAVKEGLTPKQKSVLREYRYEQERSRQNVNRFLEAAGEIEYIQYIDNYLAHFYVSNEKKRRQFVSRWMKNSPNAKSRTFPTLKEAVDAGLTPLTQNVSVLHSMWAKANWRVATNRRFVAELKNIRNADGKPVMMKPDDAPEGWVIVDHPAVQQVYGKRRADGTMELWRGGVAVDPEVYQITRQVFEQPFTGDFVKTLEMFNAYAKKSALSLSMFHHWALTESAQATLARASNPVRGLVLVGGDSETLGTGFRLPLTNIRISRPHTAGMRLMESPEFRRDAIQHGLQLDSVSDAAVGHVQKGMRTLEAKTAKVPGLAYLTRKFRQANDAWDAALWNRFYTGLKAYSYYDLVGQEMARLPEGASATEMRRVKEKVAELVNDMYGGQEWVSKFWLTPKGRQISHWVLLAPDWTFSNLSVAGKVATQIKDPVTRRVLGRYWRNMLLFFVALVASANKALTDRWPWENEPGHQWDIDVTSIMEKLPWHDPEDKRRRYIKPGKQFREVLRYGENPIEIIGAKLSPAVHIALEQMTGHQSGAGWEMPWVREDMGFWQSLPERTRSIADKFIPFSARGGNFAFTFPMSKGMGAWTAQRAYEDLLRATLDPTLFKRVMPWQDAERLRAQLDASVERNGLDVKEMQKRANTTVRGVYYGQVWQAIEKEDFEEADRVAKILIQLGVKSKDLQASGERRDRPKEQIKAASEAYGKAKWAK